LAKAEHKSAKQSLDNLDRDIANDLKAAQTKLATAKASYDAALANRIQDEIRAQELESAKAAVKTAEAQLKQARNAHLTTLVRKADITTAMSGVASSQAQLDNARKLMDQTVITAPNDGVILKKYVEEGAIITSGVSSVAQGTNIVQIGNTNTMIVNTAVDETDIAGIEEGMKVDVTVDAYPSSPFEGRVRRISPEAVAVQNVTTINVEVEILDVDPRLKPGLNATCEFIIERRTDVLLVPNEAVKEKEDGSSYVTVLEGEKQIDKKVQVGLQGNSDTEIKSGLKEGEYVITAIIEPQQEQARNPGGGVGMFGGGMRGASRQMGGR
jgi:HlyD family secretion protein